MALINTVQVDVTGVDDSPVAAAGGGDTMTPDDRAFAEFRNTSGAPITVTLVVPGSFKGQPHADVAVVVPATTGVRRIGPLTSDLADPTTGLINFTYSGVTNLTVEKVRN